MLISSFTIQNGTLITPLLVFRLHFGLVCTKIHRFVEYTPKKCFNSFVQSAVDSRRQGDKNPNSSVVAETMRLLANSSYGYQIMDRSRHTVMKYLTDEKTHAAINSKLCKKLDHVNNSLYEVELAKAQIENKEPIFVEFFFLQYAKLRVLEPYYNFFTRLCDVNKFEELEMDTDSLYLAIAEKELEDCIRAEMRAEWQRLRSNDCVDNFTADAVANFFPRTCCVKHKQHDKREPGLFIEEFRCRMLCLCRHNAAMTSPLINLNLAVKVSTNAYWNRAATDHWKIIGESWTWKKPSFRTIEDSEQTITLLPPMKKLRRVSSTFIKTE